MTHRSSNDYNEELDKNYSNKSLADRINELELYYADTVLPENLKMIYAQIQEDCSEFRNNIFFKMLDIYDANMGKFGGDKQTFTDEEHEKMLKEIKTTDQLMQEFSEKCHKYSQ